MTLARGPQTRWERSTYPDPARLWIAAAPRRWPGSTRPWTDLIRLGLGSAGGDVRVDAAPSEEVAAGRFYLPPVEAHNERRRRELAEGVRSPQSALVQCFLGDRWQPRSPRIEKIYDPLPELLGGDVAALSSLPRESRLIWPLVPGLTDEVEMWREGCGRLAESGALAVQPVGLELEAGERRRLAAEYGSRDARLFDRLFHDAEAGRTQQLERGFSRVAAAAGLGTFVPPVAPPSDRRSRNRSLADVLALAAELWLRCSRPESEGQGLYRAARWAVDTRIDVASMIDEGNVEILDWLGPPGRSVFADWRRTGASRLVDSLMAEYCSSEGAELE